MKSSKEKPEDWMRKNFPSADARKRADEAVDKLDVDLPMKDFIDVWVQAYREAVGPTVKK